MTGSENRGSEPLRALDDKVFFKLMELEERINKLFEIEKTNVELFLSQRKKDAITNQQIALLQMEKEKFNEAYYHIFPDRLKKDVKLQEQLKAIKAKPKPDADPEESC